MTDDPTPAEATSESYAMVSASSPIPPPENGWEAYNEMRELHAEANAEIARWREVIGLADELITQLLEMNRGLRAALGEANDGLERQNATIRRLTDELAGLIGKHHD